MSKKKLIVSIILYVVIAVLVAVMIVATAITNNYSTLITNYFGQKNYKVVNANGETIDIDYYKSDYATLKELQAYEAKFAEEIQSEGAVLLKNNGALPLKKNPQVTILGTSSAADSNGFLYGGGGSGAIDTKNTPNLKEAFEANGYTVNPTLWDFYHSGNGKNYRRSYTMRGASSGEAPQTAYSATEYNSFGKYNDAAIIVIGRVGQESADLSTANTSDGDGKHILELSQNELDLIKTANNYFDKVIVLLNTMNAMELGPIESGEYEVDACLWVGAGGQMGVNAIPKILDGTLNPSGRLVDTYAYDAFSSPAMQNFGTFKLDGVTGDAQKASSYISYAEGIYVGYRYYETRYADAVLGQGNAGSYDYATTVQFPFGYGLSYSEFEYSNYSVKENADSFDISVTVTNKSATTDKAVIQIYMQSPYTDYDRQHGVEKSAVELVGFEKTSPLGKDQSETVTVTVTKENMRSWDSAANNGKGGYIVENEPYYFAFGTDAHNALNNILAAQNKTTANGMDENGDASFVSSYTPAAFDSTTYNVGADGEPISNEFKDADLSNFVGNYTYLSRNDWTGTWPVKPTNALTVTDEMNSALVTHYDIDPDATKPVTGTISDEYGKLSLVSLRDVDYNDPRWDALTSQMTTEEMITLVRMGGYATEAMSSVSKPATVDKDGPAGISASLVGGAGAFGYPIEVVIASTWNLEIASKVGDCIGEDGYWTGVSGWYAPSMNNHRTPFAGRNFEYYSEDGFIAGKMGAATVKAAQAKGVYCYMKHFVLNDQESGRSGISTFTNEQALREIYLRPFEITVREGDCHAAMVAMNRIGCTWVGAHKGLMTDTLRNEWGFQGFSITDQASTQGFEYYNIEAALVAGNDLFLNTDGTRWPITNYSDNATLLTALHKATKNILFTVAHSNAMNGISEGSSIVSIMPTWQVLLVVGDVIVGVAAIVGVFFITRSLLKARKQATTNRKTDGE